MRFSDGQVFAEMVAFAEVARRSSFSRAAEALGIEVANLSRTISRLERRVGVRLLNRTTRTVSLTSAGSGYLETCLKTLTHFEQAQEYLAAQRQELSGQLRISIPMTFGLTQLGPILTSFSRMHPKVQVEVLMTDDLLDLSSQRIDAAIRIGTSFDPGLHIRPLARTPRILCASQAYLDQHGTPVQPSDLWDHKCLAFTNRPPIDNWVLSGDADAQQRIAVRPVLSVNNSLLLRELVMNGMGIAPIAEYVVTEQLAARSLVRVLAPWTLGQLDICAVYLSGKNMPGKVRAFIDFCVVRIAGARES